MRRFYLDTSVLITLVRIGRAALVDGLNGEVVVPDAVVSELVPAEDVENSRTNLELARLDELSESNVDRQGFPEKLVDRESFEAKVEMAARHLGKVVPDDTSISGDIALLALGLADEDGVIVTDDKPLRQACKTRQVPVSGSIGVLIEAVKRGELDAEEAKDALVAMDEVGARLSARLLRRAERLIDAAEVQG